MNIIISISIGLISAMFLFYIITIIQWVKANVELITFIIKEYLTSIMEVTNYKYLKKREDLKSNIMSKNFDFKDYQEKRDKVIEQQMDFLINFTDNYSIKDYWNNVKKYSMFQIYLISIWDKPNNFSFFVDEDKLKKWEQETAKNNNIIMEEIND